MKKMVFALVAIVACAVLLWVAMSGNEKLAQLRIASQKLENELQAAREDLSKLESENVQLRAENAKLKETDQAAFSKGVEEQLAANSKERMRQALDTFTELTTKFPKSPLIPNAKQHIAELQKSISDIEQLEAARSKFEDAFKADRFKDANAALQQLSGLISADEHRSLSSRLYEAENRPIEMTVNELVSRFGSLVRSGNLDELLWQKVKMMVFFYRPERDRKSIYAMDKPDSKTWINVFYAGSNMEDEITRKDPDRERSYKVTGVVCKYANTNNPYILADKIE